MNEREKLLHAIGYLEESSRSVLTAYTSESWARVASAARAGLALADDIHDALIVPFHRNEIPDEDVCAELMQRWLSAAVALRTTPEAEE
jgi:hypothetical protein